MPAFVRKHVAALAAAFLGPRLDLLRRLADDPLLDGLAVAVELLEPGRELAGLGVALGHEEVERDLRPAEPPGGVDARREPEGDRTFVDRGRVDACRAHKGPEPGALRASELPQPGDCERTVLVDERHDVGDRRERDEVQVSLERIVGEGLEQLEGDTGATELCERVRRRPRGDDGAVRKLLSGSMVVGDHDVKAQPAGGRDLVDRRDAAVDREHEPVALVGELLEGLAREAVALLEAAREVPADVGAELPEREHREHGRADAVHVVVAVDADLRPCRDRACG